MVDEEVVDEETAVVPVAAVVVVVAVVVGTEGHCRLETDKDAALSTAKMAEDETISDEADTFLAEQSN